jgi:ribosomal protein L21E
MQSLNWWADKTKRLLHVKVQQAPKERRRKRMAIRLTPTFKAGDKIQRIRDGAIDTVSSVPGDVRYDRVRFFDHETGMLTVEHLWQHRSDWKLIEPAKAKREFKVGDKVLIERYEYNATGSTREWETKEGEIEEIYSAKSHSLPYKVCNYKGHYVGIFSEKELTLANDIENVEATTVKKAKVEKPETPLSSRLKQLNVRI